MDKTPWYAVNLMTEEVNRYASEAEAYMDNRGKPVDVIYRPRKRKAK